MATEMQIVERFGSSLPVDIKGLIENLGILYDERVMDDGASGRIDLHGGECVITINASEGEQRRRFSAAHELGHYLLHGDLLSKEGHLDRLYSEGRVAPQYGAMLPHYERQANQFAADLLMPANILAQKYDPVADNVRELAELCAVSNAAMEVRLRMLGIRNQA